MNGHRLFTFTPSFEGNDPANAVCSSNFFLFNHFRTPVRDRNALNSFRFNHLRTTFIATEVGLYFCPFNTSPSIFGSRKSFRMRSYAISRAKFLRMRSYKKTAP